MRPSARRRDANIFLAALLILSPVALDAAESSSRVRQLADRLGEAPERGKQPVTVIVEGRLGGRAAAIIDALGGKIRYSVHRRHEVRFPGRGLDALIESLPDELYVRLPYPHKPLGTTGDGVSLTGAGDMHATGYDGSGTTVGVIDIGFSGYRQSQDSGDLPPELTVKDYTGSGMGGSSHGTNVAEIVHDIAPGAGLFLAKVGTDVQLDEATNDMIAAGVKIINHSVAWFGAAYYDGTGPICSTTDSAESNGIQWVNAAGNERNKHWLGPFTDADGDRRHEFASGQNYNTIPLSEGRRITLILSWDDYPVTTIDYDLLLYDEKPGAGGSPVASSTDRQNGNPFSRPVETLSYTAETTATHYVVAEKESASTADISLTLFAIGPNLSARVRERSLPQPADCPYTLATGATRASDDAPEGFSSAGPTVDGRVKPQIAGPDRVATSRLGAFAGTSASSPHVAGAAALLLSRDGSLSPGGIRHSLAETAHDVHITGFDDRTGYGRLSLDADQDGLNQDDEASLGTDPADADTDSDDLDDGSEVNQHGTDPTNSDTDADALIDGDEIDIYGTDPLDTDTDDDTLADGDEVLTFNTDPTGANLVGDVAPRGAPDGTINIADLEILMRLVEGHATPTSPERGLADVDGDGDLDIRDVLMHTREIGY